MSKIKLGLPSKGRIQEEMNNFLTSAGIDIKKDGYEAFVLAEKYHKGFSSFDSEEGKKSGGDFLRIKPVPTIDSKSNQNTFLDSFSCRLMYEKELISVSRSCDNLMKRLLIQFN